jgi:plasmid replication initiation protein
MIRKQKYEIIMARKQDVAAIKNYIVKSNQLVEARYRLSLQESQIVLWLLTQIRPDDEDFKSHVLEISEFARLTGVSVTSKYDELRRITKRLMQRVLEIYEPDKNEYIQVAWLNCAHYKPKKGIVELSFSSKLQPYLLQLKSHFTKIDLVDTLKLKSVHAIRIFELLLQYLNIGKRTIPVEELRRYCGISVNEYKDYFDFKRFVIEKAKQEINAKTEYDVDYEEIEESRKVVTIEWTIKKKKPAKQSIPSLPKEYRSDLAMIEAFGEYGFTRAIAKKILKDHDIEIVKNALKCVNLQVERGNVRNPKAMLQMAILEKWHPETFKVKRKAK